MRAAAGVPAGDGLAVPAADPRSEVAGRPSAFGPPRAAQTPFAHEDDVPIAPLAADSEAPAPRLVRMDSRTADALHAVRSSIFGLNEAELCTALELPPEDGAALVERLVAEGRLTRRGRRLVAGEAAEASPARVERGA